MAEIHGYAGALLKLYKGEKIEINMGEIAITMNYDDHSIDQKSLIRGTLKDAIGDALIIICDLPNGTNKEVVINSWNILTVTKFDATGSTKHVYYDEGSKRLRRST